MSDARETSIRVRDGLLLLEERERGRPETLIEELEAEATASLRAVQNLIDSMARQRRLFLANGVDQAIANPQVEIGGTFSRARWMEIKEVFDQFEQWLSAPLPTCQLPPLVVVSRRGNPPEPAQPEEPPAIVVKEETKKRSRK